MNHAHLAWEFADLFRELPTEQMNEMLANNVPFETLEFFNSYADSFAQSEGLEAETRQRLANLLVFGYLLRVLEDRLIEEDGPGPC